MKDLFKLFCIVSTTNIILACGGNLSSTLSNQGKETLAEGDNASVGEEPSSSESNSSDASVGPPDTLPEVINSNAIYISNSVELRLALDQLKAGDLLVLNTASYGDLKIQNKSFSDTVEIRANANSTPIFNTISITGSSNFKLNGLKVRPSSKTTAVTISGFNVTFLNGDISFSDNTSQWNAEDWNNRAGNGIHVVSGEGINIYNNKIVNINFGIASSATRSHVRGNIVDYFAGDGLRALGDDGIWEENLVTNNINVNDNHDDGIQAWTLGPNGPGSGFLKNIIIRKNTFIESTSSDKPFPGALQGIGFFDGIFKDFLIEDNVIVVSHWHGIAVYGAENVTVQYNTVVDLDDGDSPVPWIKIENHKNGTAPKNSVVRSNLSMSYRSAPEVDEAGNEKVIFKEYSNYFIDWLSFDFKLKPTAPVSGVGARF